MSDKKKYAIDVHVEGSTGSKIDNDVIYHEGADSADEYNWKRRAIRQAVIESLDALELKFLEMASKGEVPWTTPKKRK